MDTAVPSDAFQAEQTIGELRDQSNVSRGQNTRPNDICRSRLPIPLSLLIRATLRLNLPGLDPLKRELSSGHRADNPAVGESGSH